MEVLSSAITKMRHFPKATMDSTNTLSTETALIVQSLGCLCQTRVSLPLLRLTLCLTLDVVTFVTEDPGAEYTDGAECETPGQPTFEHATPASARSYRDPWQTPVAMSGTAATLSLSPGSTDLPIANHYENPRSSFSPLTNSFEGLSPQMGTSEAQYRLSANIDFILNPHPTTPGLAAQRHSHAGLASPHTPVDHFTGSPESHVSRGSQRPRQIETDAEVAFLLRYFSEVPGKWHVNQLWECEIHPLIYS